jgi:hypothetical protein
MVEDIKIGSLGGFLFEDNGDFCEEDVTSLAVEGCEMNYLSHDAIIEGHSLADLPKVAYNQIYEGARNLASLNIYVQGNQNI